jgi:hypothetical protein
MRDTIETVNVKKTDQVKVYQPGSQHVVGDGFHVRNLFPSNDLDRELSPFIMLDYAGPTFYPATTSHEGSENIRTVGSKPSRSSIRASWRIAIQPGIPASLVQARCNG